MNKRLLIAIIIRALGPSYMVITIQPTCILAVEHENKSMPVPQTVTLPLVLFLTPQPGKPLSDYATVVKR